MPPFTGEHHTSCELELRNGALPDHLFPGLMTTHRFHGSIRQGCVTLLFNLGAIPMGQEIDTMAAHKGLQQLK